MAKRAAVSSSCRKFSASTAISAMSPTISRRKATTSSRRRSSIVSSRASTLATAATMPPKASPFAPRSKLEDTLADIAAAVEAASVSGAVGIVGYCWGGTLAFAAAQHVEGLAAAVGYYGSGIAALPEAQLRCPVMLHFGDQDKSIPLADIEKIRREHPDITIHIYPAGHGFSCNDRSAYEPESAKLARERDARILREEYRLVAKI